MNLFTPDLTPLIKELREFKAQQAQIIALLEEIRNILATLPSKVEENNKLLQKLIPK